MTYQIEKISDLLQVPIDRREACVRDLLYALALHELAFGEDAKKVPMGQIKWTDDDDHSVSLCDPGGTAVLSLKITKDAPK
jgi:hypothetical protein